MTLYFKIVLTGCMTPIWFENSGSQSNVPSLLRNDALRFCKRAPNISYSPFHISRITEFIRENLKFHIILNFFCRNQTHEHYFWPNSLLKNQQTMHYNSAFKWKRDITLANPRHKICCSTYNMYLSWKFLLQIFLLFISFIFMKVKSSLIP